ncbi:MAG: RsmD family RNA methyltransferase [Deltaproteobacteria bacterium]|nr:RsmD family RNA methyltransferase [Deltaproteobacteria bacterium]
MIKKLIEKEIKIDKLVHRGLGLGHKNGRTFMVYYSLPGEIVDAEIIMTKKSYSVGKVSKIHNSSIHRTNPICEYYQVCGGCQLLHTSYQFQLEAKRNILKELLFRATKKEFNVKYTGSDPNLGYRLRAQFLVKRAKVGYTKFNSNDFVRIDKCHICHNKINEAINHLNKTISSTELGRLYIATDGNNIATFPIKDYDNHLKIDINGYSYILKPHIFFQANIYTLDILQREVIPNNTKGRVAIDFYAGSGFFSLPLSKDFELVLSIEESPEAHSILKENILINKISNIKTINSSVEDTDISKQYLCPDLIILDPPRAGMSKNAIHKVLNIRPKRIVYVSCDPATLSRDISYFLKNSFHVEEIILIDQFPQTFHFETVVKLLEN